MNIAEKEIHVWILSDENFDDRAVERLSLTALRPEEIRRSGRFLFEKHRKQFILTRWLLRLILSEYCAEIRPLDWEFDTNAYGKPHIQNRISVNLEFNLSHTDGQIVLALAIDDEIGVDVEFVGRPNFSLDIAQNYFSPVEVTELYKIEPSMRISRFFDLWTLKEAYIKACGQGLSIPLDHFAYSFLGSRLEISFNQERNDDPSLWNIWLWELSKKHVMSVALKTLKRSHTATVKIFEIDSSFEYVNVFLPPKFQTETTL